MVQISIHAPARGATLLNFVRSGRTDISIHAPARGATAMKNLEKDYTIIFQSTLPRGERPYFRIKGLHLVFYFNPRSREGSDRYQFYIYSPLVQFQSTLPRGERRVYGKDGHRQRAISIHAPARGATNFFVSPRSHIIDFNPRSREGSDARTTVSA